VEPPGGEWTGKGEPVENAETVLSIKAKFGVTETGAAGVAAAFKELSAFIQKGGLADDAKRYLEYRVIKPGDWIDLEGGLEVDAYGLAGADGGAISLKAGSGDQNPKLRLVVVGINSFRSGKGSGGKYTITANDGVDHVVFHFKDVPGLHRMKAENNNLGGYEKSEMWEYVTGNFLAGLKNAGVPEGVLHGPKRYVSADGYTAVSELDDLLWLPTVWELYENGKDYNYPDEIHDAAEGETEANQARLEYYANAESCKKTTTDKHEYAYWLASATFNPYGPYFCDVETYSGQASAYFASSVLGCVPAFCVK
jgi:hypothetical protein